MPSDAQRRLGRGLSALLGDESEDYAKLDRLKTSRSIGIDQLRPGRFQPRRRMSEAELDELTQSIAAKGILQPLLVRRIADDPAAFEIVAGERRWRAAQRAGLHEVPVLVRELADGEALEVALVENLQRQDLSPLEEAEGFRRLMEDFGHTQEALAKVVGKSRSHVANCLRLLSLPEPVKALIETGELTAGHARALVTAADPAALAAEVVARGLTVRATEDLARDDREPPSATKSPTGPRRAKGTSPGSMEDKAQTPSPSSAISAPSSASPSKSDSAVAEERSFYIINPSISSTTSCCG